MAKIFDEDTFNKEVKEQKGKVLIDFYADWCEPCKRMAPVIETISEEYEGKVTVGKINIDNYPDIAVAYKIMSIPTLILFDEGNKLETIIGLVDKGEIDRVLQKYL